MSEEIKPKKERKFLKALGKIGEVLIQELFFRVGSNLIRKIGGKKTLPSILFLFLSLSLFAQFPNTLNKQRLGFQTTGDGLVWRGSISDTASIQPINNQNAWVILDTVNLKMYSFDFTSNVWNLVGGAQGLTMPFDSITFNTAKNGTVGVGEVEYNDTQGSLIQGLKGGNVTNVIGQQLHQRVNNRTGAPLAKGDVVYLAGSQGNRITVAKGLAVTDAFSANTFGVVAESIADNASGFIITEGLITGLNTSALTEDSAVYLSPTVAGALTSTKPQAPQHSVYIGVCVKSNNGSGELFVKIRNGLEMDELHDTRITNPVTGATLYYSGGLWRDTTAALLVSDTASMLLPYLRDADTVTLSNRINLKLNIADTSAFARDNQISGTSGQVAYFNSSSSVVSDTALRWSAANKSLGINMTSVPSGANLILKNSQEPVRSTVVANQTFGADTTNWTRGAGWTFNGTQAVATAATGDLTYNQPLTVVIGNAYEIKYTLSNYSSGTLRAKIGNVNYALPTYNVTNNVILIVANSLLPLTFTTIAFTGNLDDVSVVEVANPSRILLTGQDDNSSTLYSPLRMPNETTIGFGGGGAYNTGANNVFYGQNAGQNNTTGFSNVFIGNSSGINNTTGNQNNFFGLNAGLNNTIGLNNNFFGSGAGQQNTTGNNNNFFGLRAGQKNTNGVSNNFFGSDAGANNTTGSFNNFFGNRAGLNNTTGGGNFFGFQAGENNTTGTGNFIGSRAALNNTTGIGNNFIGDEAGFTNSTGNYNVFLATLAGYANKSGSNNISIGYRSMYNTVTADTLTGSNNIAIGANAADNIRAAAAGNVAIGNAVDLPTNNGSNQGVYQNVLFFTGASGSGTTIAAASKAGIKTNAPNRDLEVSGEVRITDLTTDAPTRLVGADADGDLGQVTLGAGLNLASSSLLADTNFLVTRFDTASMLTNYLRTGVAASTYLTQSNAASTYLPLTGGTLTGGLTGTTGTFTSGIKAGNITPVGSPVLNAGISGSATEVHFYSGLGTENNVTTLRLTNNNGGFFQNGLFFKSQMLRGLDEYNGYLGIMNNNFLTFTNNNRIGVFQGSPSFILDVNGTLGVTGATTLSAPLTVNSSAVFNEAATDSDFRVESEANAHMLFVDASTSKVGIGYASPTKTLDVNGEVRINTVTAPPTSLLGKDGSNVVGEVTTVAQTGLMTRGETTATTGTPSATFTVTHGLGVTPTSVLVTSAGLAGAEKIIFEVYAKNSTTFSVQAWNYDGTEASSKSVKIFWLAIK